MHLFIIYFYNIFQLRVIPQLFHLYFISPVTFYISVEYMIVFLSQVCKRRHFDTMSQIKKENRNVMVQCLETNNFQGWKQFSWATPPSLGPKVDDKARLQATVQPPYMTVYPGPPPPSGTVHSIFCFGSLISQACTKNQRLVERITA